MITDLLKKTGKYFCFSSLVGNSDRLLLRATTQGALNKMTSNVLSDIPEINRCDKHSLDQAFDDFSD